MKFDSDILAPLTMNSFTFGDLFICCLFIALSLSQILICVILILKELYTKLINH